MEDLFIISSNTNFEFLPIIVFSPSPTQYEKLVLALCDNRFSYPIYIDRSNSIRRNNPFLKYHHRYQGFLLDKNDKIVLVGNPIGSDAMWSALPKDARQHARQRRALYPRITDPEQIRHDTPDSRGLLRRNPPDRLRRAAETLRRPGGRKPRDIGVARSCKLLILKKINNTILQKAVAFFEKST